MTATPSRWPGPGPMVHLRTVPDAFHARVIAARLGADGILTELRGAIGGPYPIGAVSVWVDPEDEPVASELLLADELEAAFEDPPEGWETPDRPRDTRPWWSTRRLLAVVTLAVLVAAIVAARLIP